MKFIRRLSMQNINKAVAEDRSYGKITTFEAFWNICNTIQGLPILSIAYVIQCGGTVSLISLLAISCTSCYTSYLIVACMYICDDEGNVVRVRYSFADVGSAVWMKGGGTLVLVTQFVQLILICSLYPFIVGSVLRALFGPLNLGIPLWIWILFSALPFLPNIFVTNLSQVAWTSIVVIASAGIIFGSVLVYSFTHYKWNWSALLTFNADKFPVAVMWLMSSYFSQPFVAVIEESMSRKERFGPILIVSFIGMTSVNICMGVIAAVTFFPETKEVITNNLPAGSLKTVAALTATVLSFASFTLPIFTVFEVLEHFYVDNQSIDKRSDIRLSTRQVIYRCLITALTILLATIPNFSHVVAFFSSVTGTSLEVIFPAVFHIKLCYNRMTLWQLVLDVLILIFGVTMIACGVFLSVRTLALGNSAVINHVPPHLRQYAKKTLAKDESC